MLSKGLSSPLYDTLDQMSIPLNRLPCAKGLGEAVNRRKFAAAGNMSPHFSIQVKPVSILMYQKMIMKCSGNQLRCFFDNPEFVFLSDFYQPNLFCSSSGQSSNAVSE